MGGGEDEGEENGSGKENDIGRDCSNVMDFSVRCDNDADVCTISDAQSEAPNTGRKQ